jgi:hypothetical protein
VADDDGGHGELARIVAQADEQLRGINPSPFSPQAFRALQEQISRYIAELIGESTREAKRRQLDTVSETHVERPPKSSLPMQAGMFIGMLARWAASSWALPSRIFWLLRPVAPSHSRASR